MDQMLRWTIRLYQLLRHPPSRERLILMAVVIALCLGVFAVERLFGWPAWMTVNHRPPRA